MSVDKLLNNLTKVQRKSNNAWMACCPAHDDRSPSLSIKDIGDGKLVLKCFAGCETIDVLGAIGLDWDDVMPPKQPVERIQTMKPQKPTIYATDALRVVKTEAQIITMAAMDITKGRKINEPEMARIKLAMERIKTLTDGANA
jgi:DNA primase